ncbi:MAG: DUF1064 domain-containing protein [Anaeroplasma sp.]
MFAKGSKYGNKRVIYNGIKFASQKEYERYRFLEMLEKQGEIQDLQLQVKFELIPAIKKNETIKLKTKTKKTTKTIQQAITYICDFAYYHNGIYIVEDVKSSATKRNAIDKVFLIKEKLFRWKYGYNITKVYKPNQEIPQ